MELYDVKSVYNGFEYPAEFVKVLNLNLIDFEFWYFMTCDQIDIRIKGLQSR